jgi:hypothetical protein
VPFLAAIGTVIVGFIVGVILIATDHVLIGIVVALAAIPGGLVAWMAVGDRY